LELIIFDKDGVLLDLSQTWLPVALDITYLLSELTEHEVSASIFQDIIGIDEETRQIDPDGLFAAGSFLDQQAACAEKAPILRNHFTTDSYREKIQAIVDKNALRPPAPLGAVTATLDKLRADGYRLAVLTNDSEKSAMRSLTRMSLVSYFEMIVGYDSGFGGKPDPTGFHAICDHCHVSPDKTIMIGDTSADRNVAQAAGAGLFVGISASYPESTKALDGAKHLLPNINGLPDLLESMKG